MEELLASTDLKPVEQEECKIPTSIEPQLQIYANVFFPQQIKDKDFIQSFLITLKHMPGLTHN